MQPGAPSLPDEPVLSTLNKDGTRRWLRPRLSPGRFLEWRRWVAYGLIVLFTTLPWIKIKGKPALLFDLAAREFTFFGTTFLPTDTLLLALLLLSIFLTIFLLTALFGRVWCGWGCPQTVYMEYVYRPLERLLDPKHYRSDGRVQSNPLRQAIRYVVYLLISLFLAHVFLAYFVGVERLFDWMHRSPFEHPSAFLIMAFVTALMMLDFCYFREQVCTLMCPYGRFQSVLLDKQSLIVGYDQKRGEPRGKRKRSAPDPSLGDCVDCNLCVVTCPTGIDIRKGLQMECIGCAQCIDACDAVMDKLDRPRGLIRYSSQQSLESGLTRLFRPRVVVYPTALVLVLGLFFVALASRASADVSFLRNRARPYQVLETGEIANTVAVKIANRTGETRSYQIELQGDGQMSSADLPLAVDGLQNGTATVRVVLPPERFQRGRAEISLEVRGDDGFAQQYEHHVLGPLFSAGSGSAGGE